MLSNGGKYEHICQMAREAANSEGASAIVIIFDGEHGNGFSVQATPRVILGLPNLLEHMAQQIRAEAEEQIKKGSH